MKIKYTKKIQQLIENATVCGMEESHFCCNSAEYPDYPCWVDVNEDGVWDATEESTRKYIIYKLRQIRKHLYKGYGTVDITYKDEYTYINIDLGKYHKVRDSYWIWLR